MARTSDDRTSHALSSLMRHHRPLIDRPFVDSDDADGSNIVGGKSRFAGFSAKSLNEANDFLPLLDRSCLALLISSDG